MNTNLALCNTERWALRQSFNVLPFDIVSFCFVQVFEWNTNLSTVKEYCLSKWKNGKVKKGFITVKVKLGPLSPLNT